MNIFSPYIIAILLGWIVAQGAKYILVAVRQRRFDHFRQLYLSGNMPSAHSATVMALASVVLFRDGIDGALFAVSALLAGIVMYDAVMVRRSSGEQGVAIQRLIKEQKSPIPLPRAAKGHTPLEVLVGAILGTLIGLVVFLATK
ncbi:MAG TPA: divergent PAP2 family protein [Candidatus Saccharimonadales bacterium]|nr:divergent PAP2 family protein [Candidatus Saccharimonadales bacterium]